MAAFLAQRRLKRFATLPVLAIALFVAISGGLGYTAVRANGNVQVEACVNKYTGAVRMNQSGTPLTCTQSEFMRAWAGTDQVGLSEFYIATAEQTFNDQSFELTVTCPLGRYVTGGGVKFSNNAYHLVNSYPDLANQRWVASATATGVATPVTVTVYAYCAMFGV